MPHLSVWKESPQLKSMSKKAHALYPLALLALESKRKNYPYEFISCLFDSDSERKCCEVFVRKGLFNKPEEGKNVHFRIGRHHVDFLLITKYLLSFIRQDNMATERERLHKCIIHTSEKSLIMQAIPIIRLLL